MPIPAPVKVFCSYSHHDQVLKQKLEQHLFPFKLSGKISLVWSDDELVAGDEFDPTIKAALNAADVVLLLISANYFSSPYCWRVEAARAFERHDTAKATVVSVLLSPVIWEITTIGKYVVLPRNRNPITTWPNQDEAFKHVADQLDRLLQERLYAPSPAEVTRAGELAFEGPQATNEPTDVCHCVPAFQSPPVPLRASGVTELLPDLVLQFRGEIGADRTVDIWLFANTNVTSQLAIPGNLSEAALMVASTQCLAGMPVLSRGIRAIQSGVNSLTFLHVPLHELRLLRPSERNLRICNVRVNACLLGGGGAVGSTVQIHVYLRVTDITVHPTANLPLASVTTGEIRVGVIGTDTNIDLLNLRQSRSVNLGILDGSGPPATVSFAIKCIGFIAGSEEVGHRTRLVLEFYGVSRGVSLFATIGSLSNSPSELKATLMSPDADASGPFKKAETSTHTFGFAKLDSTTTSVLAIWEIEGSGKNLSQEVMVGFVIAYRSEPTESLPGLGSMFVRATLAPLSEVPTASTGPIPRFCQSYRNEVQVCSIHL